MPAMKKRKADGPVVVNVDTSAPRRTYKKKGTYARRASSNWRKFSKLKPWADYGAMRYPRGTAEGISRFGQTYAEASPEQRAERAAVGWRGRGMYTGQGSYNAAKNFRRWATGAVSNVGRGVGRSLNSTLVTGLDTAGTIGNSMLAAQGAMALAGQGMYTGQGLYAANSLIDVGNARPSMTFSGTDDEQQCLVLSHKEFVGDVFGPADSSFNVQSYPLQPGLSSIFPFLAQFAQNFDEYEMVQMVWEFHSTVDSNSSTNTSGNTGTIIMATNYKADAIPFANKDEMIQYHGGISGRLTEPLVHGVECDPNKATGAGQKYIRTFPVPMADIKSYDIGLFQIAFQNVPPTFLNQQVGELWVYYTVKLSKPKLFAALGNGVTEARFLVDKDITDITKLVPTASNEFLKAQNNSFNPSVKQNSITTSSLAFVYNNLAVPSAATPTTKGIAVTFPAQLNGVFEITINLEFSGGTISTSGNFVEFLGKILSGTTVTASNCVPWIDMFATGSATGDSPAYVRSILSSTSGELTCRVKVGSATNGIDNIVLLYPFGSSGTGPTTVSQWDMRITEIGTSFQQSRSLAVPVYVDYTTNQVVATTAAAS